MTDLATPSAACTPTRETLSAHLDREAGVLALHEARDHASSCEQCERFETSLAIVTRRVRVTAADAVPDLTAPILSAMSEERARVADRRLEGLRILAGLAGIVHLLLALPVLFGAAPDALHLGRDLGALELALGVGLIFAAYQPHRAAGVLPVVAAAAGVVIVGAGVDLVTDRVGIVSELSHLTELVGVIAVWALTRRLATEPPCPDRGGVT